jgi:hypothetical protein
MAPKGRVVSRDEVNADIKRVLDFHFQDPKVRVHDPMTPENRPAKTKKANDQKDQIGRLASLAALGITLAVAVKIASLSLNKFLATDGAQIKFDSIRPSLMVLPSWLPDVIQKWLLKILPKPKNILVNYTVTATGNQADLLLKKSDVNLLKDDTVTFSGTGLGTLDGTQVLVLKVPAQGSFIVNSGLNDSSNVYLTGKGTGVIHTSYDDQMAQEINQTASDFMSVTSKIFGGVTDNLATVLFIVIVCLVLYFIYVIIAGLKSE